MNIFCGFVRYYQSIWRHGAVGDFLLNADVHENSNLNFI